MATLKNNLVDLNYYKGNIVIQCNYKGKVFRYNTFKIHEKYFDKSNKTLKPCDTLFDVNVETDRLFLFVWNQTVCRKNNEASSMICKGSIPEFSQLLH